MLRTPADGAAAPAPPRAGRPGLPVDPRRVAAALRRGRRAIAAVVLGAAVTGGLVGKFIVPKSYQAEATVLWQPSVETKQDARVELATLAASVKLPSNLQRVRDLVLDTGTLEALGKRVDVKLGDAATLITIAAKAPEREAAAELANATVEVFLDAQREVFAARHREIADALRASLAGAEETVRDARDRYDTFRDAAGVGDMTLDMQAAIEAASKLRIARDETRVELDALRAKEIELRSVERGAPTNVVVASSEQRPDVARLAQVEAELTSARALHAPDHPTVRSLAAEASALRARATTDPTFVTQRTMGRNVVRDAISVQAEESGALRRAIEEKSRALTRVQAEADARTAKLTTEQGEAARRLADVETSEQHVAALLRQIAIAEDDVRSVSSGFRIVSSATPPARSEKGLGRVVAVATPALALVVALLVVLARELGARRLKTAREVAFFTGLPVRWASAWPRVGGAEARELGREVAIAVEALPGVVGLVHVGAAIGGDGLPALVAARMLRRGRSAAVADLPALAGNASGGDLADALEGTEVRAALDALAMGHDTVLAKMPPPADREAYHVAAALLDAAIVVVESGALTAVEALGLARALELDPARVVVVVVGVADELVDAPRRVDAPPAAIDA